MTIQSSRQYDPKTIAHIQTVTSAPVDGVWGGNTVDALTKWHNSGKGTEPFRPLSADYDPATIAHIQTVVNTTPDGAWGPKTVRKLAEWRGINPALTGPAFRSLWDATTPATPKAPPLPPDGMARDVPMSIFEASKKFPDLVFGTDFSKWQKKVDPKQLPRVKSGLRFAVVKATQGGKSGSELFDFHWQNFKAAGIPRAAYAYIMPVYEGKRTDGRAQAQNIHKRLGKDQGELPVVLDWEPGEIESLVEWHVADGKTRAVANKLTAEWLEEIVLESQRLFGYRPMLYWHREIVNTLRGEALRFKDDLSWWAYYPKQPKLPAALPPGHPKGYRYTIWQYSSSASLPGVGHHVDANVWNGTQADFDRFLTTWRG